MATLRIEVDDPTLDEMARFVELLDLIGTGGARKIKTDTYVVTTLGMTETRYRIGIELPLNFVTIPHEVDQ